MSRGRGTGLNIDTEKIEGRLSRISRRTQGLENRSLHEADTKTTLTINKSAQTSHTQSQTIKQLYGTNVRDILGVTINTNTSWMNFEETMRRRNSGGGS